MATTYEIRAEKPSEELAVRLTAVGFNLQQVTEEFQAGVIGVLGQCTGHLVAYDANTNSGVGFIGYTQLTHTAPRLVYANTVMVDPAARGNNLAGKLLVAAARETSSQVIAFRTQSPLMYAAARKVLEHLQPDISGDETQCPEVICTAIDSLLEIRGGTFPVTKVTHHAGAQHQTRLANTYADRFYSLLDPDAGDTMYCIGLSPLN